MVTSKLAFNKAIARFASQLTQELVGLAQPKPGDAVLHVVSDRRGIAWLIASEVNPLDKGIASDQVPEIMGLSINDPLASGWTTVHPGADNRTYLPFSNATFDIIFYSSSVSHLADPLAGLQEWHRILKPAGTLGFCGYADDTFQPLVSLFEACSRRYGITPVAPVHPFTRQPIMELEAVSDCLRNVGFTVSDVRRQQLGCYLDNPEEWWHMLSYCGAQADLAQLAPNALARFKTEHLAAVAALATLHGIWLNVTAIFAMGQKK